MAPFSEELDFDISRALASIDRVEEALNRSATQFRVGILNAVDNLRDVRIEIDTAGLSAEISRAINGADLSPRIDPDTSRIGPSIDDAVPPDIDVPVRADTEQARRELGRLEDQADSTTDRLGAVKGALAAIGVAGAAEAVRTVVDAFSALEEQTSGSEVAFGAAADEVQRFAAQASSIGLAADEALRASNQFGLMAGSAGLAEQAAADFAQTIVSRGADIASLRDLDLSETLDRLRSGLTGETEPLRDLGIFLNAAKVEARAFELGLADASGAVSDAALIQARYSLILEESAVAANNFADTSEGLANSQRKLQADFRNLLVVVGAEVAPAFADLVGEGRDLLPLFRDLAIGVLPPLVRVAGDLAPVLGSALQVLVALTPIVELFADVIGAIPTDLITFAGSVVLLNTAFAAFRIGAAITGIQTFATAIAGIAATRGVSTATAGLGVLRSSISGIGSSLAAVNPAVALGTLALGGLAFAALKASRDKAEFRKEVQEATAALRDEQGQLQVTGQAIGDYILKSSAFESGDQIDDIRRLGLTLSEVGALAGEGAEGIEDFANRAQSAGEIVVRVSGDVTSQSFSDLRQEYGLTAEQLDQLITTGRLYAAGTELTVGGNRELLDSFSEVQAVAEASARAELIALALRDDVTGAIVRQAEAENRFADGSVNVVGALEQVNNALETQATRAERAAAQYGPLISSTTGLRAALAALQDESVGTLGAIIDVVDTAAGPTSTAFVNAALAIDQATLSEEGFAAAAALLGTDVAGLTGFIDTATGALDDFVNTAVGKLPTLSTVFSDAFGSAQTSARDAAEQIRADAEIVAAAITESGAEGAEARADAIRADADLQAEALAEAAVVTAAGLTEALNIATADLADFRSDLAAVTAAGFPELAAMLAEQGAESGGALADELETALAAGNTEILQGLQDANDAFETESNNTLAFIRDELGPQMLSASGLIAAAISENFGSELTFEERMRIAAGLAATELDEQGQAIATIAAVEGAAAAQAYSDALGLDQAMTDEAVAAGVALAETGATVGTEGGVATGQGFADGMAGYGDAAAAAMAFEFDARLRRDLRIFSPSGVAFDLGDMTGQGFVLGFEKSTAKLSAPQLNFDPSRSGAVLAAGSPGPPPGFSDSRIVAALDANLAAIGALAKPLVGSLHLADLRQLDPAMRELAAQKHLGGW